MQAGATAPPFHPWCRGTTAPYYEDLAGVGERFARNIETGEAYKVPAETTYEQWKDLQEAKYGNGSVDTARKKHIITDKTQSNLQGIKKFLRSFVQRAYQIFKKSSTIIQNDGIS